LNLETIWGCGDAPGGLKIKRMFVANYPKAVWLSLTLLFWWDAPCMAQAEQRPDASSLAVTNPVAESASGMGAFERISFATLASFPLKVDWLVNPTNSALDTLRRTGEIPALVKALDGKKVSVQGYVKPLKQDASGVTEFLLMRDHALCCQTNVPQINEWIHVRMEGRSVPFAHERQFTVRGVLQVGELRGAGNVVSVYRLAGDEIIAGAESH
jgi:hypothetical protein